jgi:hypothetical protein
MYTGGALKWVGVILVVMAVCLYMGQLVPFTLPGVYPHYRTVTIVNSTTVTYTTTVSGKTVTTTTTIIETTTTTVIVNHTTTVTSTMTLPYTPTTTTVVENLSSLPPLNSTNLNDTINWMRDAYITLVKETYGLSTVNLTLPLGYCEATYLISPYTARPVVVGAWIFPVSYIKQYLIPYNYSPLVSPVYTFPRTGIKVYSSLFPGSMFLINPMNDTALALSFFNWIVGITNYPYNGYTVVVWAGRAEWFWWLLKNGTYIMILASPWQFPISPIQNPPDLCLVQVIWINSSSALPWTYVYNITYLGAQYVAWLLTEAQWGKPAPCYAPWFWSLMFWESGGTVNVTEPTGSIWEYYCGPKGVWESLKPPG